MIWFRLQSTTTTGAPTMLLMIRMTFISPRVSTARSAPLLWSIFGPVKRQRRLSPAVKMLEVQFFSLLVVVLTLEMLVFLEVLPLTTEIRQMQTSIKTRKWPLFQLKTNQYMMLVEAQLLNNNYCTQQSATVSQVPTKLQYTTDD